MLKNKFILLVLAITILFVFPVTASAKTESLDPFKNAKEMEKKYPEFGKRPWEEKLKTDIKKHENAIKNNCEDSQKKYEEKLRKIKEQKELEKKKKEEEQKRLLEEAKKEQDEYTKVKKEELADDVKEGHWKSIGVKRITHYCPVCNTPAKTYASSSGKKLYEGAVACSWLPLGAIVKINDKVYKNEDHCGTDAIDIFRDTPNSCSCNNAGSFSTEVYILKK